MKMTDEWVQRVLRKLREELWGIEVVTRERHPGHVVVPAFK